MSDVTTLRAGAASSIGRIIYERVAAEVPAAMERLSWDRTTIEAHQVRRLRLLIAHAQQASPFHADRLADVDAMTITLADLASLPTMTKAEMMARFDDVVTDRRLRRELVEAHVRSAPDRPVALLDRYFPLASGGSSGERGLFVFDLDAMTEFSLDLLRQTLSRITAFGITGDAPLPSASVMAPSTVHATGLVTSLFGPGTPLASQSVPANLPFDEVVTRLERQRPSAIVAYASMLVRLAEAKASGRLTIEPFVLTATSEPFDASMSEAVEAAFGVRPTNTFGSSEGLVGVTPPDEPFIRFAEDSCIVELVDEDHRPVPPGATSAKVLVTNLANLTQPLIRYELTDQFIAQPGPWPDGHLRAVVEGRRDDPLEWGSDVIHPIAIRSVLATVAEVLEYQVRQTTTGIDLLVVATPYLDEAEVCARLTEALEAAGLSRPSVRVERVDGIERDRMTGKARRVVPLS